MKYLKYFEGFTDSYLNELILNNKTYVKKNIRSSDNKVMKYSSDIIKYDISNFKYDSMNGFYIIYPDYEFMKLYKKYCVSNSLEFINDIKFNIEILPEYLLGGYNFIDVYKLIPDNLKGLSLAYKLYKFILDKVNFIMTNKDSSPQALNLWFNILKDDNVYSGTNDNYSIIIKKDISDFELKSLLDKIEKFNLIYDYELNSKKEILCKI